MNQLRHFQSSAQTLLKALTLTSDEFEEVFKSTSFSIWDIDRNGVISVFEVFAGITMISGLSARDKFRCDIYVVLFFLFDFNNENKITLCDLQVLCHLSVLSVCKIFGYFSDIGPHEILEITVGFPEYEKIDLATMLDFCMNQPNITSFISICERLTNLNKAYD